MSHKITVEIPSDGSCKKCVFFDQVQCLRFDWGIYDYKPLEQCENKNETKKDQG